ncbi:hypothetical protein F4809DRAFT_189348 [Biscogniauxia mediterranea]|nr:hypothetical protein F4809DRAFT_189348 [Biscogniauxia mediterranea]
MREVSGTSWVHVCTYVPGGLIEEATSRKCLVFFSFGLVVYVGENSGIEHLCHYISHAFFFSSSSFCCLFFWSNLFHPVIIIQFQAGLFPSSPTKVLIRIYTVPKLRRQAQALSGLREYAAMQRLNPMNKPLPLPPAYEPGNPAGDNQQKNFPYPPPLLFALIRVVIGKS